MVGYTRIFSLLMMMVMVTLLLFYDIQAYARLVTFFTGVTDAIRICLKTRFGLISSLTPREKSNFRLVTEPDIQFIGDLFFSSPSSQSPPIFPLLSPLLLRLFLSLLLAFLVDTLQALCGNAHHRKSFRTSSKYHDDDDEDDTHHLFAFSIKFFFLASPFCRKNDTLPPVVLCISLDLTIFGVCV